MIRISLGRLAKEAFDLEGGEPAALLELDDDPVLRPAAPVSYCLHAQLVSGDVLVTGRVSTRVAGPCGRCLEETGQEVVNDHVCLCIESPEEEELDITEDIRGELLLELPMNLLCSEECKGLCPHCGANLNRAACSCQEEPPRDSPWNALDNLR